MARMTGKEIRQMIAIWPTSRIEAHIRSTRQGLRQPSLPGFNGYLPSGPNRPYCWMVLGVMLAEMARRAPVETAPGTPEAATVAPDAPAAEVVETVTAEEGTPQMTLATDLAHAVTHYDRAQARGKRYNPNALGIYLGRCDEVAERVAEGEALQAVLQDCFNDRLLDRVTVYLRGLGYPVEAR